MKPGPHGSRRYASPSARSRGINASTLRVRTAAVAIASRASGLLLARRKVRCTRPCALALGAHLPGARRFVHRTRRPPRRARPRRRPSGWLRRLADERRMSRAHDRGLRPRRAAVSRLSRRALRRAAVDRRFHRLRAGRPARLSRAPPRGGDRGALAAARALGAALARAPHRPRGRRDGGGARRDPRAQGRRAACPARCAPPTRAP